MSYLYDVTTRFWDEMVSRPSGPLAFRFILQPTIASILAIRDGYKDARDNRSPYLATILNDPARRMPRLREGIKAVTRVLCLGVVMEAVYQFIELKAFRPVEMIVIVVVLAFIPYLIVRGPAGRIARRWLQREHAAHPTQTLKRG
jgi:hypothetical protein